MSKVTLSTLIERFRVLAQEIQGKRFALGDIVNLMLVDHSMTRVVSEVKLAIPNVHKLIGHAVNKSTLTDLANAARTFTDEGGFLSPDGMHRVQREDLQALELTPTQVSGLADLMKSGAVKVKRVADDLATVQKHGATTELGRNAINRVKLMVANGTDKAPTVENVHNLTEQLAKVRARKAKLEEEERVLVAKLAALVKPDEEATAVPAPTPTVSGKGKRGQVQRPADTGAQLTA